jgi:hypothetical protein
MNKLAAALSRFSDKYVKAYRDDMPIGHLKALSNISQCRTEAYGKFVDACTDCGTIDESYGACRNRACPKCNNVGTSEWIEKADKRLPNTSYYHVVFTVPSELRPIARRNQKVFYDTLMRVVGETLNYFADGGTWGKGRTGFLSFLHTWDSKLCLHPHVHVILMGGFLNEKGEWLEVDRQAMYPVRALSNHFKTVILKRLREAMEEKIPSSFWRLPWIVYMKKTFSGSRSVIEYLGRYVKKIGVGASRILQVDKHGVVMKYRHRLGKDKHEWREMRVSGEEFMRRYLQHVLPKGFVRIRYHGLMHSSNKEALEKIRVMKKSEEEEVPVEVVTHAWVKACRECHGQVETIAQILPEFFIARKKKGWKFYIYKEEEKRSLIVDGCTPPHNQLIEPTARGRHAFRVAKGAPVPSGPSPSEAGLRPCSRLISALYGRPGGRSSTRGSLSLVLAIRRVTFRIVPPAQHVAFYKVCATFKVHRLRKRSRPELP